MTSRRPFGTVWTTLLLSATILTAGNLAAQESGSVTGTVTDATTMRPLTGAQVVIEGTNFGALADERGRYLIPGVPAGTHTLRAIIIGFGPASQTITVPPGGAVQADFSLAQSAIALDQIVVTATGEQRKREIGNALSAIQADQVVETKPITNLSDLLQARAPGVQLMNSSGTTGMGSRIRIRGSSSLSLNNEPLIYIDGVRISNSQDFTVGTGGQEPTRLNDINPEDIESIEIVKGPAASTLYGTEAANGVIRITTKRGRAGDTRWTLWAEGGIVQEPNEYPLNYVGVDADNPTFDDFCLLDFARQGLCSQDRVLAYQVLHDPALTPIDDGRRGQLGMSVSGGTSAMNFYVSAEVEDEVGPYSLPAPDRADLVERGVRIDENVERPNNLDKVSVRANLNSQLSETATLSLRAGYLSSDLSFTGNDNNSFGFLPSAFFGGATPETAWGFQRPAQLFGRDILQQIERFTGSLQSTWSPLAWLDTRATVGLDYTNQHDISFFPRDLGVPGQSNLGDRDSNFRNIYQYTLDASATGTFELASDLSSRTTGGVQFFRDLFTGTDANGFDIVSGGNSIGLAANNFSDEETRENKTLGIFAEQQFGWRDRLFVTAAIRADDNSAFGRDYDLIYYPKFSLSWIVSDEDFFPQTGFLDQLRFRGAWGKSGLQPGSDDAIRTLAADAITDPDDETVSGVTIGELGNALLEPEQSQEIELGFDADLLDGRLGLELTYYDKDTEAALLEAPLAPSLGAGDDRWINLGRVENKGWEFGVLASLIDRESFGLTLSVAGSLNDNTLTDLGGNEPIGTIERFQEGFPLGGYWERPILGSSDADGDGILSASEVQVGDTAVFIGPSLPEKEFSFSSTVRLLEWIQVYGLLDYRGGYFAYNNTERFRCRFRLCGALIDPATPLEEQERAVASLYHPSQTVHGYIEDADFFKLREVAMTLFVPAEWASRFRAERASLTLSGRNLGTWTDYTGMDPEINSAGASDDFGTSEFLTQPPVRYWTLRFNFTF